VLPAGCAAQQPSPMSLSPSAGIGADPCGLPPALADFKKDRTHSLTNSYSDFSGNGDLPELTPEKAPEEADRRAIACERVI
jgi:hypothetical protein